jgi:hypothetical protein
MVYDRQCKGPALVRTKGGQGFRIGKSIVIGPSGHPCLDTLKGGPYPSAHAAVPALGPFN